MNKLKRVRNNFAKIRLVLIVFCVISMLSLHWQISTLLWSAIAVIYVIQDEIIMNIEEKYIYDNEKTFMENSEVL